jgi:hypothetical protein
LASFGGEKSGRCGAGCKSPSLQYSRLIIITNFMFLLLSFSPLQSLGRHKRVHTSQNQTRTYCHSATIPFFSTSPHKLNPISYSLLESVIVTLCFALLSRFSASSQISCATKMPTSASSHNFSLPSTIFRSRSEVNLRPVSQNPSSLYSTAAHCATESALPYINEDASSNTSSDNITALPPQEQQLRRKKSIWNFYSNSSDPDTPTLFKKRAPDVTTTVVPGTPTRKPTKTTWNIIVSKFKSPFARMKKRKSPKKSPERKQMLISSPSNFQHVVSGGGMPFRQGDSQYTSGGQQDEECDREKHWGQTDEWEDME